MRFRPMLGRVAVEVVFVDGPPGSAAAFTAAERLEAMRYAAAGTALLARLANTFARRGPVTVREMCSFDLTSRTVPLGLDPASVESSPVGNKPDSSVKPRRDDLWQGALVAASGFSAGTPLSRFTAEQRRFWRTQRRFGRTVADSLVILVTKYGCYWPAYVDAASDAVVIWFPALQAGWGDKGGDVFAHEIGHVFEAPDEYGHCRVTDPAGFFDTANTNCKLTSVNPDVPNPGIHLPCLMDTNQPVACAFTELHWGWDDSDADGVADLMAPATFALSADRAQPGQRIELRGRNVWDARVVSFRPFLGGGVVRTALPTVRRADLIEVSVPVDADVLSVVEFATRAPVAATSPAPVLFVNQALPPVDVGPVVWGVLPNAAAPGSQVRVIGAGLGGPQGVMFGGVAADPATIVPDPNLPFGNDQEVVLTVPAGVGGTVEVSVTTVNGTSPPFPPFSQFTAL